MKPESGLVPQREDLCKYMGKCPEEKVICLLKPVEQLSSSEKKRGAQGLDLGEVGHV